MLDVLMLKPRCPLAPLNALFPTGVPVVGNQPEMTLQDKRCWELNLDGLNRTQLQQIAAIAMQDEVPLAIQMTLVTLGVLAIPADWIVPRV